MLGGVSAIKFSKTYQSSQKGIKCTQEGKYLLVK